MAYIRLIARLDIKGADLIKTVQLEGLRVVGDPRDRATRYYRDGIDELVYMDIVASLYGRNNLHDIVSYTAENIFVPLTAGGGVRSVDDIRTLLLAGADKVAINTAAVRRPELIREAAEGFGSQCIVLSVEAKQIGPGRWEAYTDNGRESSGLDAIEWVRRAAALGAGEILVTSIDREGTRKGYDVELVRRVSSAVRLPVIASGGMGSADHIAEVVAEGGANAVAIADAFHFDRMTVTEVRDAASASGVALREPPS